MLFGLFLCLSLISQIQTKNFTDCERFVKCDLKSIEQLQ